MRIIEDCMIRNYRKGDEEGITTLFREVFGKVVTLEQWKWKYALTGSGKIYSKVVTDSTGKIIGHTGAIPLKGIFQKKTIPFFQIADVMIHPDARGHLGRKGVFERLSKALFEDISKQHPDAFCYGFPGIRHFKLGKLLGLFEAIEPQAVDSIKQPGRSLFAFYTIKAINWDDKRLDGLWTKLSSNFPLSLERNRDYLLWRYAANPFFSYQIFGIYLFGQFKGWIITRETEDEILLIDFLFEKKKINAILAACGNFFLLKRGKSIRFWVPETWRKIIKIKCTQKDTQAVVTNVVWTFPMSTSLAQKKFSYTMGDADIF